MTYPTPTKSGLYWAKEVGDNMLVIVELFNGKFWLHGSVKPYEASDFTFGPEVVKPDYLEDDK